jgi:hypothetical protein
MRYRLSRKPGLGAVAWLWVFGILALPDCTTGERPAAAEKVAFVLEYNNAFDQTGDDVGGAKKMVDVPIVWTGTRVLEGGGQPEDGDTFTKNQTWNGFATDPWKTSTIVTNLNPGNWNLSVIVSGTRR